MIENYCKKSYESTADGAGVLAQFCPALYAQLMKHVFGGAA